MEVKSLYTWDCWLWFMWRRITHSAVSLCLEVARKGDLDTLKWLVARDIAVNQGMINEAALGGSIETIEWLMEKGVEWTPDIAWYAALENHWNIVEWALDKEYAICPLVSNVLAYRGALERLDRYYLRKMPINEWCMVLAVREGHIPVVEWYWETIRPTVLDQEYVELAARRGYLKLIAWLRERDYPWNDRCLLAIYAKAGLKGVKKLRAWGCPWGYIGPMSAVQSSLELYRWVHSNGCPLEPETIQNLWLEGHYEEVKRLVREGAKIPETLFTLIVASGSVEMVEWAVRQGMSLSARHVEKAIRRDRLELVKWMIERHYPRPLRALDMAYSKKMKELLRYYCV